MGLIARVVSYVTGQDITAALLNNEFNSILNEFNGNIETANLKDGAVTDAKLGTGRVAIDTSKTADNFVHAATTKTMSFQPKGIVFPSTNPGVANASSSGVDIRATAADAAEDNSLMVVGPFPIGVTITRVDIYGFTASGTDNQVQIAVKRTNMQGTTDTMCTLSFNDGAATAFTTSITNPTVDETRAYYLWAAIKSVTSTGNALYRGIKFTYSVDNLKETM
jgi:hypothetical protein